MNRYFCLSHLSDVGAWMYCIKLSMSIPMIFVWKFLNENGVRTTLSTETIRNHTISMHFDLNGTTVQISTCMVQYRFQSLFINIIYFSDWNQRCVNSHSIIKQWLLKTFQICRYLLFSPNTTTHEFYDLGCVIDYVCDVFPKCLLFAKFCTSSCYMRYIYIVGLHIESLQGFWKLFVLSNMLGMRRRREVKRKLIWL